MAPHKQTILDLLPDNKNDPRLSGGKNPKSVVSKKTITDSIDKKE